MPASELATVALTLKLAAVTTVLLLLLCLPLAWWLASGGGRWRHTVMAVAALPLVLPPTVLGFYLLLWMAPGGWLGDLALWLRQQSLAFTFEGLVIGSLVYSLPFAVFPLRNAFLGVPRESLDAASTLGAGPLDRFFTVALPLSRPGLAAAAILTFAHTVGEFGVVLMIGGSIPGETRVLSIAIFEQVEALNYQGAHWLSALLVLFSFTALLLTRPGQEEHRHA
jgi:molybdate transport system permease protein